MNKPFRTRTAGLLVVAGLTGLARPAAADSIPTLTINLQVPRHVNVPLTLAKDEVTRIYRDAGVNVVWMDAASSGGGSHLLQSSGTSDPGFALVVLPREMSDQLPVAATALGVAMRTSEHRGRLAYVFYNRVEHIARTHLHVSHDAVRRELYSIVVLAHAMAHEMATWCSLMDTRRPVSCAPIGMQRTWTSPWTGA